MIPLALPSLAGLRVAVTRAREAGPALTVALRERGADVAEIPLTAIERLPDAPLAPLLARLTAGDVLVLTSANGARCVVDALRDARVSLAREVVVAVVGSSTGDVLTAAGIPVTLTPTQHDADGLVALLARTLVLAGRRVLFPCAEEARPTVRDALTQAGAQLQVVPCYASRPAAHGIAQLEALLRGDAIDLLIFAAPSAVRAAACATHATTVPCVVIGPVTARAAREAGFTVAGIADDATPAALVDAVATAVAHGVLRSRAASLPISP
ncbi:MAG: uroporphyrinogen-III synthase [Gemmatimonadaceae bacterium]|jgi:uroporphyrinogen-III synthase|nr:uroporphyrinogen-III synthase [Gemmatimonadaceae bacterium]